MKQLETWPISSASDEKMEWARVSSLQQDQATRYRRLPGFEAGSKKNIDIEHAIDKSSLTQSHCEAKVAD